MALRYVVKIDFESASGEEKSRHLPPRETLPEAEGLFSLAMATMEGRRRPKKGGRVLSCALYRAQTVDHREAVAMVEDGRGELMRSA